MHPSLNDVCVWWMAHRAYRGFMEHRLLSICSFSLSAISECNMRAHAFSYITSRSYTYTYNQGDIYNYKNMYIHNILILRSRAICVMNPLYRISKKRNLLTRSIYSIFTIIIPDDCWVIGCIYIHVISRGMKKNNKNVYV